MSWHIYPAAAAAAVRRSVRPCRHGTKRVLFSRHSHTHLRRRIKWPTRPVVRGLIRCRTNMYTKKKEIWVSLSRRAQIPHSTRTKVHGSAPLHPHHKPALHYLLVLATYYYYGDKDPVCFKSRMFVFSAVPYSYPRHTVYTLPPSTYHAPLQGGRTTPSSPAVSYIPYPTRTRR